MPQTIQFLHRSPDSCNSHCKSSLNKYLCVTLTSVSPSLCRDRRLDPNQDGCHHCPQLTEPGVRGKSAAVRSSSWSAVRGGPSPPSAARPARRLREISRGHLRPSAVRGTRKPASHGQPTYRGSCAPGLVGGIRGDVLEPSPRARSSPAPSSAGSSQVPSSTPVLCWSRPAYLRLRWSRSAHLRLRWSRPAHLRLRWSRPVQRPLTSAPPERPKNVWGRLPAMAHGVPGSAMSARVPGSAMAARVPGSVMAARTPCSAVGPGMGTALENVSKKKKKKKKGRSESLHLPLFVQLNSSGNK